MVLDYFEYENELMKIFWEHLWLKSDELERKNRGTKTL